MILETLVVGPLEVNCYLISEGPGYDALVIDPGDDGGTILERIRANRLTLKYILNTHGHFDHVGANRTLKEATGAKILIHEKDAPLLAMAGEHARSFGLMADPSPPADLFLKQQDRIEVGGLSLQVLATPGHSDGGVCLLMDKILFSGDTLFAGSIGRTDLPGGSFRRIMISIQEVVLPLDPSILIYPGHGPHTTIGKEKRTNPFLLELCKGFI
ncbi:MAG: MBL fold metallo-hydrolase [bacterium]